MFEFASALVIVWPDGRFRVSSERGYEEWQAVDETIVGARYAAHGVVQARHLPPEGGSVHRHTLYPWEEIASA